MRSKRCRSSSPSNGRTPGSWSRRTRGLALLLLALGLLPQRQVQARKPKTKRARVTAAAAAPATVSAAAAAQATEATPAEWPRTTTGSLAPGVYYEDTTNTIRSAWFASMTISKQDPDVAYVGSYDGYVWKTTDGGQTWDESRLVVEPKPFFGDAGERVYFGVHRSGVTAWGDKHKNNEPDPSPPLGLKRRVKTLTFGRPFESEQTQPLNPGGRVGTRSGRERLLSLRPDSVGYGRISAAGAGRVSAAANVNFGIGLPGGAPRLQNVVRKFAFGRPTKLGMVIGAAGLNVKQTLLLRGVRIPEVRRIVIHPHDPKTVFACTMFGLFASYDGGLNWIRTFQGVNPDGRRIYHIAIDPNDGDKVFMATGNGMYISTDRGGNFIKSTAQGLGEVPIDWVYFSPYDSRYVFACTNYGVLRSADGGDTWDWIYFTTFPAGRIVRAIVIDPFDKKTGYIATHDGLYTTPNVLTGGLESWKRLGGLRFTGHEAWNIKACPKHSGHLWTLTNMRLPRADPYLPGYWDTGGAFVWESIDGGINWKVVYSGMTQGSMSWFDNDPNDPDLLWIVWSRAVTRMRRQKPSVQDLANENRLQAIARRRLARSPTLSNVIIAAMRYAGVESNRRLDYRFRSRLKSLVPRLDLSYTYYRQRDLPILHDGLYALPFRFRENISFEFNELRAMLTWDLSDLVFNLDASLFGRVARLNGEVGGYMASAVHRLYGEYRRLNMLLVTNPPRDLRVRLMYKLRLEEIESYIDFITGGYLSRFKQGDQPSGWDTPWFEPWPMRGADRSEGGAHE